MTAKHIHRKIPRTPEETARLRADRERYQRDKPTPDELLAEGGHTDFTTLGELLTLHQALASIKQVRESKNVTLAELSQRTGIDTAALSRLESGQNANPTFNTLLRVFSALGKKLRLMFQDDSAAHSTGATVGKTR